MSLGLLGVGIVVSGDLGATDAPLWAYLPRPPACCALRGGTVLGQRIRPAGEGCCRRSRCRPWSTAVLLMGLAGAVGEAGPPADVDFWLAVAWLIVLASLGGYVMYVFVAARQGATVVSTLLFLHAADHDVLGLPDVRHPRDDGRTGRPRRQRRRGVADIGPAPYAATRAAEGPRAHVRDVDHRLDQRPGDPVEDVALRDEQLVDAGCAAGPGRGPARRRR